MDNNRNTPVKANLMKKEIGRFVLYKELSKYYTADQIDQMLVDIATHGTIDLNRYVKKTEVDSALSPTSEMPVQNKVIYEKLMDYYNKEQIDEMLAQGGHIVDPTPTKDSSHAVSSGGTFGALQQLNEINATLSKDGKIYNNFFAGDIYYTEQDNGVRVYWVAFSDGEASAEHPVTINALNFYRAENAVDAVRMSLSVKTVSTEQQQSLTSEQKRRAQQNIGLEKDVVGGVAGLDGNGKIGTQQIPTTVVDGANLGSTSIQFGDAQQLTPAQQVQAQNNMMSKAYVPALFSGLGKKVLSKNMQIVEGIQKNVMTQAFFQDGQGHAQENTVYVIQYDYDLNGGTIEIPAGCTLEFDGGSLSNGTIVGNETKMDAPANSLKNITKRGTWFKDTVLPFDTEFDYIVETQADYESLFDRVANDGKTSVSILFRNGVFSANLPYGNTLSGKQNISLYGDGATLMGKNVLLNELDYYSDGKYNYYDVSDVFTHDTIGNACVLDINGNYIPYNFISFIPTEYPAKVSGSSTLAKIRIPQNNYNFLKNKDAEYFKFSYIRVNSCWNDSKATISYSDENYIYFNVPQNNTYYNYFDYDFKNLNYGSPVVRVYNIPDIAGVSMSPDRTLRVPKSEAPERLVTGYRILDIKDCYNITIQGLSFVGCAPYCSNWFEDYSLAAVCVSMTDTADYKNVDFSMLDCYTNGIQGAILGQSSHALNSILISRCHLITNFCVLRIGMTVNDFVISNNLIEGTAKNFNSGHCEGLINCSMGDIKVYNNEIKNFGDCGITSTEVWVGKLNAHSGYIKSNFVYNEDDFFVDKNSFIVSDRGGIYVCHRTEDIVFEIYDNVVYNVPNGVGIYLDGNSSNVLVKSNLVYKTTIAININYDDTIKNPSLAINKNLAVTYNLIGDRCMIHSHYDGSDSNECIFNYNQIIGTDIFDEAPFNNTTRPHNFEGDDNSLVPSEIHGKAVVIKDKYKSMRESLVSSFLIEPETASGSWNYTRRLPAMFISTNSPLRCMTNRAAVTINTIIPISRTHIDLLIRIGDTPNHAHICIDSGTVTVFEDSASGVCYIEYANCVTNGDYSVTVNMKFTKTNDWYISAGFYYLVLDSWSIMGYINSTGTFASVEKRALYLTFDQDPTIDGTLPDIAKKKYSHYGPTAARPINAKVGHFYYDTDIQKPVFNTGTPALGDNGWVDANGDNPYNQTT